MNFVSTVPGSFALSSNKVGIAVEPHSFLAGVAAERGREQGAQQHDPPQISSTSAALQKNVSLVIVPDG